MPWSDYWPILSPILGAIGGRNTIAVLQKLFWRASEAPGNQANIAQLQQQLRENTEITKQIDQSYLRADVPWQSELGYRERQLSELYDPAYGYVKISKEIYELWMEKKTPEINLKVKQFLTKQNEFVRDLLISKVHLIEGARMPERMSRFATSILIFDFYASPTERDRLQTGSSGSPPAIPVGL